MGHVLAAEIERFVRTTAPDEDAVLEEMATYARRRQFPAVGPDVGGALRLIARLIDARRIFEFGSGYGYSAYWFAGALPADGEIVLTEVNENDLEDARTFMARGGFDDVARYELGDALETIDRYDGPFDAVLLDHQNDRYLEAFEAVRNDLSPGGVLIADNVIGADEVDLESLLALVRDENPGDVDRDTNGIGEYLRAVRRAPDFETVVLPLGEGISVSVRLE
ncbi:O-methyltransferase [Natrinema ejinorense]|uniref:Methyltransferase n=1 Tax=Natrinema ejinorense TaxID=373386 RepID=A0A2A5QPT4_9EURY|nr:O-methyltransferase [Natrinema ejinorense]PCR88837.1 methyltransferase [Natrinema ejinorense]